MCTQIENETETTIEEAPEVQTPRDIDTLLAMHTYQGMSDDEIRIVLDYEIQQAISRQALLMQTEVEIQTMEQVVADNKASAKRALDMIQSIIEAEFDTLPVVQPRTFEPRSIGE